MTWIHNSNSRRLIYAGRSNVRKRERDLSPSLSLSLSLSLLLTVYLVLNLDSLRKRIDPTRGCSVCVYKHSLPVATWQYNIISSLLFFFFFFFFFLFVFYRERHEITESFIRRSPLTPHLVDTRLNQSHRPLSGGCSHTLAIRLSDLILFALWVAKIATTLLTYTDFYLNLFKNSGSGATPAAAAAAVNVAI